MTTQSPEVSQATLPDGVEHTSAASKSEGATPAAPTEAGRAELHRNQWENVSLPGFGANPQPTPQRPVSTSAVVGEDHHTLAARGVFTAKKKKGGIEERFPELSFTQIPSQLHNDAILIKLVETIKKVAQDQKQGVATGTTVENFLRELQQNTPGKQFLGTFVSTNTKDGKESVSLQAQKELRAFIVDILRQELTRSAEPLIDKVANAYADEFLDALKKGNRSELPTFDRDTVLASLGPDADASSHVGTTSAVSSSKGGGDSDQITRHDSHGSGSTSNENRHHDEAGTHKGDWDWLAEVAEETRRKRENEALMRRSFENNPRHLVEMQSDYLARILPADRETRGNDYRTGPESDLTVLDREFKHRKKEVNQEREAPIISIPFIGIDLTSVEGLSGVLEGFDKMPSATWSSLVLEYQKSIGESATPIINRFMGEKLTAFEEIQKSGHVPTEHLDNVLRFKEHIDPYLAYQGDNTSLYAARLDNVLEHAKGTLATTSPTSGLQLHAAELRAALNSMNPLVVILERFHDVPHEERLAALSAYRQQFGTNFLEDLAQKLDISGKVGDGLEYRVTEALLLGHPLKEEHAHAYFQAKLCDYGIARGTVLASTTSTPDDLRAIDAHVKDLIIRGETLGFAGFLQNAQASVLAGERGALEHKLDELNREKICDQFRAKTSKANAGLDSKITHCKNELRTRHKLSDDDLQKIDDHATGEAMKGEVAPYSNAAFQIKRSVGFISNDPSSLINALEMCLDPTQGHRAREGIQNAFLFHAGEGSLKDFITLHYHGANQDRALARLNGEESRAYAADLAALLEENRYEEFGALVKELFETKKLNSVKDIFAKEYASRFKSFIGLRAEGLGEALSFQLDRNCRPHGSSYDVARTVVFAEELIKGNEVKAYAEKLATIIQGGTVLRGPAVAQFFSQFQTPEGELDRVKIRAIIGEWNKFWRDPLNDRIPAQVKEHGFSGYLSLLEGPGGEWATSTVLGRKNEAEVHHLRYAIENGDAASLREIFALPQDLQLLSLQLTRNPDAFSPEQARGITAAIEAHARKNQEITNQYYVRYPKAPLIDVELKKTLSDREYKEITTVLHNGQLPIEDILYSAMKFDRMVGVGVADDVITNLFINSGTLTKKEISDVASRYNLKFKRKLERDLDGKLGGDTNHDVMYVYKHGTPVTPAEKIAYVSDLYRYETSTLGTKFLKSSLYISKGMLEKSEKGKSIGEFLKKNDPDSLLKELQSLSSRQAKGEKLSSEESAKLIAGLAMLELALNAYRQVKIGVADTAAQVAGATAIVTACLLTGQVEGVGLSTVAFAGSGAGLVATAGTKRVIRGEGYDGGQFAHDIGAAGVNFATIYVGGKLVNGISDKVFELVGENQLAKNAAWDIGKVDARLAGRTTQELNRAVGKAAINQFYAVPEGANLVVRAGTHAANFGIRVGTQGAIGAAAGSADSAVMGVGYALIDTRTYDNGFVGAVEHIGESAIDSAKIGAEYGGVIGGALGVLVPEEARMGQVASKQKVNEAINQGMVTSPRIPFLNRLPGGDIIESVIDNSPRFIRGILTTSREVDSNAIRALQNVGNDGEIRLGDIYENVVLTKSETAKLLRGRNVTQAQRSALNTTSESNGGYLTRGDVNRIRGVVGSDGYVVRRTPLEELERRQAAAETTARTTTSQAEALGGLAEAARLRGIIQARVNPELFEPEVVTTLGRAPTPPVEPVAVAPGNVPTVATPAAPIPGLSQSELQFSETPVPPPVATPSTATPPALAEPAPIVPIAPRPTSIFDLFRRIPESLRGAVAGLQLLGNTALEGRIPLLADAGAVSPAPIILNVPGRSAINPGVAIVEAAPAARAARVSLNEEIELSAPSAPAMRGSRTGALASAEESSVIGSPVVASTPSVAATPHASTLQLSQAGETSLTPSSAHVITPNTGNVGTEISGGALHQTAGGAIGAPINTVGISSVQTPPIASVGPNAQVGSTSAASLPRSNATTTAPQTAAPVPTQSAQANAAINPGMGRAGVAANAGNTVRVAPNNTGGVASTQNSSSPQSPPSTSVASSAQVATPRVSRSSDPVSNTQASAPKLAQTVAAPRVTPSAPAKAPSSIATKAATQSIGALAGQLARGNVARPGATQSGSGAAQQARTPGSPTAPATKSESSVQKAVVNQEQQERAVQTEREQESVVARSMENATEPEPGKRIQRESPEMPYRPGYADMGDGEEKKKKKKVGIESPHGSDEKHTYESKNEYSHQTVRWVVREIPIYGLNPVTGKNDKVVYRKKVLVEEVGPEVVG